MNRFIGGLFACWSVVAATRALAEEPRAGAASHEFIKGYSWGWVGGHGDYASPEAADSMKRLADTGAQWACIAFGASMETYDSPEIKWGDANPRMVTDDEIRHAIRLARQNHLKVILKPVVNCDDQTWRAWIRFFRAVTEKERAAGITGEMDPWGDKPVRREGEVKDLEKWRQWWAGFSHFVLHYAEIASEEHVEMFCLGCEMNSTEEFESEWRDLIRQVRKVYSGQVTYDVNHDRENEVQWWDAVDVISVSAYYAVKPPQGQTEEEAIKQTTTVEEIKAALEPVKNRLAEISAKFHKPILFIETGVMDVRGCARYPWSHADEHQDSPVDQQEQANYYQAFFEVFWDEPWFIGFAWWEWPARLGSREEAAQGRSFCVYGRKGEEVLRQWYCKTREAVALPKKAD